MNRTTIPGSFVVSKPFHMVWLATNRCNARCLHCSSNSSLCTPDELSTSEALDMIDQLAHAGVMDLAVSGGEPLLRPDLFQVIAHARAQGLSVGVGSNGSTLTETNAATLFELGVNRFQISLDGLRNSHDALRRWPGLFDKCIQSVDTGIQAGLRIHICCTINRLNFGELRKFTELLTTTGIRRINFSRYVPTGRGDDSLDLSEREWYQVINECAELRSTYKDQVDIVSHLAQEILVNESVQCLPGFIGCQAGRGQGCITANGTVLPCVLLPVPLGSIRDATFETTWTNSPVIKELQTRELLQGKCNTCSLRSRCGGCRAVAYAKTGDYLAEDPRCWLNSH